MILLLSVPRLGQAGVKRLHSTFRRIRLYELRSGYFASLNKKDFSIYFFFTALPFSRRRQLRIPGLKSKPMYNERKLIPQMPAAAQSGAHTFSLATAVSETPPAKPQSPGAFLLNEMPTPEAPAWNQELRTRFGRNSMGFARSLGTAPVAEVPRAKPLPTVLAPDEPCLICVARQPQQPVVQALKKI